MSLRYQLTVSFIILGLLYSYLRDLNRMINYMLSNPMINLLYQIFNGIGLFVSVLQI